MKKQIKMNGRIINGAIIAVITTLLILSLSPDFSPFFTKNIISVISSIQKNAHNTTPVTFFAKKPSQNETVILDKPIPSTGCGIPLSLQTGAATYIQMQSGGKTRHLLVYLPKGYNNNTQHALILAFHGYASGPFAFEKKTHLDAAANSSNSIIVYPEGTTSVIGLRGWNTGLHTTIQAKDVLFVSTMLNTLQSNLCINPNRIYATGFSNGGGFVAMLACRLSNRIAAFAPISGSYVTAFRTCTISHPVPIIEFHGNKDRIVPYSGLAAKREYAALSWVSRWANRDKCNPTPAVTTFPHKFVQYKWSGCSDGAAVVHYKIIGEGHIWPHILFSESLKKHLDHVKVTQIMWNFFKTHPLPKITSQSPATEST